MRDGAIAAGSAVIKCGKRETMSKIIVIDDLTLPELKLYSGTSEVWLRRYYEPKPGIFIAESPNVIYRALDAGYRPISLLIERKHALGKAQDLIERCSNVPVYTADADLLEKITGFHLTKGIFCAMRRRELSTVDEVCFGAVRIAVLEDVVNPTNVGAVIRSAAALGFDAVLLTPACSDPLYRRCIRVSMGTVFQIPWTYLDHSTPEYVEELKSRGFATAAMALKEDTIGVDDPRLMAEEKLALILGSEGEGLKAETIRACDYTVKIPMAHGVDSLNVAAASAVAFWQLRRK